MVAINIKERREFFRSFQCELLTSSKNNKELIKDFRSKNRNDDLQDYLLSEQRAWAEDLDGETRVYLIKDAAGSIACYFSLKCGLIVGEDLQENLSEDEREIIEPYIDARRDEDKEAEQNLYDAINELFPDRADYLLEIAMRRLERKTEALVIGQSDSTINVPLCYSGIELKHLCRNDNYVLPQNIDVPLGFGLFWEKIVPIIEDILNRIGCKYLYLFAADDSEKRNNEDVRKLVRYYKNDLKFYECDAGMKFVKPDYDNYCYGLVQDISELLKNREAIWEEFSDVWE